VFGTVHYINAFLTGDMWHIVLQEKMFVFDKEIFCG